MTPHQCKKQIQKRIDSAKRNLKESKQNLTWGAMFHIKEALDELVSASKMVVWLESKK